MPYYTTPASEQQQPYLYTYTGMLSQCPGGSDDIHKKPYGDQGCQTGQYPHRHRCVYSMADTWKSSMLLFLCFFNLF